MKRETLRHPKLYDLAARLNVDRPTALGLLTLLWDFTADNAIQGNIGKWPDGAIARACDWAGDPEQFVNALAEAGWLDNDGEYRRVVHDWADHCERWVRAKLDKLGLQFVEPSHNSPSAASERSTGATAERSVERSIEPSPPRDRTEPNRTKPNRTDPVGAHGDSDEPSGEEIVLTTNGSRTSTPPEHAAPKTRSRGRGGRRRWTPKRIKPEDFFLDERASLERGYEHFSAAVMAGKFSANEDLNWMTLWAHCRRGAARTDEGKLDNPAANFVARIRDGQRRGSNEDENVANAFLKSLRPSSDDVLECQQLADALAADELPQEVFNAPRC